MNTIIEKIRAEIKIRLSANGAFDEEGDSAWHYDQGLNDAYNYILSVLSDLEKSEKPTNLDFEQELYKHFGQVKDFTLGMQIGKYFYELGKQEKPKVCEGLEEEAVSYCFDNGLNLSPMVATDFARHFAQWGAEHARECEECPSRGNTHSYLKGLEDGKKEMREQFEKAAVEWDYTLEDGRIEFEGDPLPCLNPILNLPYPKFKPGQKVRIIVCKKED